MSSHRSRIIIVGIGNKLTIRFLLLDAEQFVKDLSKLSGETKVDEKTDNRALYELEYVD